MEIRKFLSGSAVVALSLALVAPVAAISVDTSGSAGVNVNVGQASSTNSGSGSINADTSVGVDVNGNANTSGSDSSASGAASGSGTVILFTRSDIKAAAEGSGNGSTSVNLNFLGAPASVSSNADLSAYVATSMNDDENISEIQASSDSVAVTYKESAKFFGFVPASLNATAIVDGSGNVTIKRPWYGFLFSKIDRAELESKIQARIDVAGETSGQLTAAEQAELIAEIRAAMHEEFEARANADASATATN